MAHEKLTQVQTIVFTLYEGYDVGAQSLRWTKISSWQYIGKQVPAGEAALVSRPCTSLSLGQSARVRAGSSATSTTPWPRKKHGEKCWRRLRWRRTQRGLGSPTITKRPSIAPACAAPRLLPLRAPTAGAWLGVGLGLGLGLG